MLKTRVNRITNSALEVGAASLPLVGDVGFNNTASPGFFKRIVHRSTKGSIVSKVVSAFVGMALVGGAAYAVTNWAVGLSAGSSAEGQSAAVSNLTITAVASPASGNLLFPGGNGDAVATITNPNGFPVTVTGVNLPTATTYAAGFTTSGLGTAQTGCSSTTSDVLWNFAT